MPLFQYSLVPLVGVFGLKTAVVRLGAAIWGIVDLVAITIAAGLMFGWPGAAAAAIIGALMPWHLEVSRYGIEASAASATISVAMASFFMWLRRRQGFWLLLSGRVIRALTIHLCNQKGASTATNRTACDTVLARFKQRDKALTALAM